MSLAAQLARLLKAAAILSFVLGILLTINVATAANPQGGDYFWLVIFLFVSPLGLLILTAWMRSLDGSKSDV